MSLLFRASSERPVVLVLSTHQFRAPEQNKSFSRGRLQLRRRVWFRSGHVYRWVIVPRNRVRSAFGQSIAWWWFDLMPGCNRLLLQKQWVHFFLASTNTNATSMGKQKAGKTKRSLGLSTHLFSTSTARDSTVHFTYQSGDALLVFQVL